MAMIYRPKEAFVAHVDGVDVTFTRDTFVEEGSDILDRYPHLFEPVNTHFKAPAVEAASAAPGEKRKR